MGSAADDGLTAQQRNVVGIVAKVHDALAAKVDARKHQTVRDVLETIEQELLPTVAPLVAGIVDNPKVPELLRNLVGTIAQPTHAGESILLGVALGAAVSPVLQTALAPLIQVLANETWPNLPVVPLTPDLLAAATLKGVLSEGAAAGMAAISGVSGDNFHTMFLTAGQSLGLEEALLLERRDQLVNVTLDDVLQYSNMNPKFYASAANLKYAPLSVGEVVAANLKGHLDDATAATYIGHAGIDPSFQPLLKISSGRPYSTGEALTLFNRGQISADRVKQVIAQSDINDDFADDILLLAVQYPPPRSVIPMLKAGSITEAQARELLSYHGYPTWIQDAFIKEATTPKSSATKELGQSQIVGAYENGLMDQTTAVGRLTALGWDSADATTLIELADERKVIARQNATVRMIGARYVAYKITIQEATVLLGEVPVDPTVQATLVALWEIERKANVRQPSEAQIVGAYRRDEITALDCKQRLLALGIAQSDLGIFVADGYPPTKPNAAAVAAVVNA